MKILSRIMVLAIGGLALTFPILASAASVSIQSLSPGTSVLAKSLVTFKIVPVGVYPAMFLITDSFSGSTAALSNIDGGGNFSWTPIVSDVGMHLFTITARDSSDNVATITQAIQILPPPSVTVQSLLPGNAVLPGNQLSFVATTNGFTNPTYIVGDSFSGSSIANTNITSSGNFSWSPDVSQNGEHTITIYASDSLGHGASAIQKVRVGAGPTLTIQTINPGTSVAAGTPVTFNVTAQNYIPSGYTVSDNFSGTTVANVDISTSGAFYWTPQASDAGTHVLIITGIVGAYGDRASTTQTIIVLGPNGSPPASTTAGTSSASTNGSLLDTLKAQLAALTSKMTTPASAPLQTNSSYTFSIYLHPSMKGDDVMNLQKVLTSLGFLSATANGYYGLQTETAVRKFQAAHGLKVLGVVGPATRTALNALQSNTVSTIFTTKGNGYVFEHFMGIGDTDPDVLELQNRLALLGLFTDTKDGVYGTSTEVAVKKFQTSRDLHAFGYVDLVTRNALNK